MSVVEFLGVTLTLDDVAMEDNPWQELKRILADLGFTERQQNAVLRSILRDAKDTIRWHRRGGMSRNKARRSRK